MGDSRCRADLILDQSSVVCSAVARWQGRFRRAVGSAHYSVRSLVAPLTCPPHAVTVARTPEKQPSHYAGAQQPHAQGSIHAYSRIASTLPKLLAIDNVRFYT
jgi:hypothetical protein